MTLRVQAVMGLDGMAVCHPSLPHPPRPLVPNVPPPPLCWLPRYHPRQAARVIAVYVYRPLDPAESSLFLVAAGV